MSRDEYGYRAGRLYHNANTRPRPKDYVLGRMSREARRHRENTMDLSPPRAAVVAQRRFLRANGLRWTGSLGTVNGNARRAVARWAARGGRWT